jgi:hypothetical protein
LAGAAWYLRKKDEKDQKLLSMQMPEILEKSGS